MVSTIYKLAIMCSLLFVRSKGSKDIGTFKSLMPRDQSIDCRDGTIDIQARNQMLYVSDLLNGSVKIEFEQVPYNDVLLTFTSDQSNKNTTIDQINCWSTLNKSIILTNILTNETQTFCLMNKEATTVSPLDCLSIKLKNGLDDPVWLTEDDKALAIGLLVLGLIFCLAVGFGIGIFIVKKHSNAKYRRKQSTTSSIPDLVTRDWQNDKGNKDFRCSDSASIASGKSYVTAVNPSRFDLIRMRIEKTENPAQYESENQYDLEDMPYAKAPSLPEGFRDSGISTCGPVYAISSKSIDRKESDNNGENLYLCVDQEIENHDKKTE